MERFPFELAITDKKLLKNAYDALSWPQKCVLRALYGLPMRKDVINPNTGWSELDYWAISQGSCEYDDLGFVTRVIPIPYTPKEYEQLWAVVGRRSGKTSQLMSFIIVYEALLGGHDDHIQPNQECFIFMIAHKLPLAVANMPFVLSIIKSSPMLKDEIVKVNTDEILLKNGLKIVPSPPSLKAQRGFAIPVVAMDEVGFYYVDPDSANPDVEIERAVAYAQLQFPHAKRIGISTPWTKEGLLWKYYLAGTDGRKLPKEFDQEQRSEFEGILTVFSPTAAFENPLITRKKLERIRKQDPEAFERESLCRFLDSISGFFNTALVEIAVAKGKGLAEREPAADGARVQPFYVAAIDPAFRSDSFALSVVHMDSEKGLVVDLLRRWTPTRGEKLNPLTVLTEIKDLVTPYRVTTLYSDQYQLESMQQLALGMDLTIEGVDFTSKSKAKIFGNLEKLFNQQKVSLLDPDLCLDARELSTELVQLEKRLTGQGAVQISAPEGKHDDMACSLALAAFKASWMPQEILEMDENREPTLFEMCSNTIQKNRMFEQMEDF